MATVTKLGPSCKICRRENQKLFLKGERCNTTKCAMVKRKYPPGVHGVKRQSRLSEYGQQLRSKQKAKRLYGMTESQFMAYYKKAINKQDADAEYELKSLLETRFDNIIYRLGWAASRGQARQMIGHGHFEINGKTLDIPSYHLRTGDTVTINKSSIDTKLFKDKKDKLLRHELPSWLTANLEEMSAKMLGKPQTEDMIGLIDSKQIIEFYSRF